MRFMKIFSSVHSVILAPLFVLISSLLLGCQGYEPHGSDFPELNVLPHAVSTTTITLADGSQELLLIKSDLDFGFGLPGSVIGWKPTPLSTPTDVDGHEIIAGFKIIANRPVPVADSNANETSLFRIIATSEMDIWVAAHSSQSPSNNFLAHWDGSAWSVQVRPGWVFDLAYSISSVPTIIETGTGNTFHLSQWDGSNWNTGADQSLQLDSTALLARGDDGEFYLAGNILSASGSNASLTGPGLWQLPSAGQAHQMVSLSEVPSAMSRSSDATAAELVLINAQNAMTYSLAGATMHVIAQGSGIAGSNSKSLWRAEENSEGSTNITVNEGPTGCQPFPCPAQNANITDNYISYTVFNFDGSNWNNLGRTASVSLLYNAWIDYTTYIYPFGARSAAFRTFGDNNSGPHAYFFQ